MRLECDAATCKLSAFVGHGFRSRRPVPKLVTRPRIDRQTHGSGSFLYNPEALIGRSLSHFQITAKLGSGGMGEVYRALDTRLGREVAIKILPDAFTSDRRRLVRFEREARALASLNHPNIAGIFDLGKHDGTHFLVLELVEGPTLDEEVTRRVIPPDELLSIARQITAALAEAHDRGIIHRDLKPQNIKLTNSGQVKVLDFGLAKRTVDRSSELTDVTTAIEQTQAGAVIGTVGYMAPEQVRGERIDQRADIFSLGCVLHELATGDRTFLRASPVETLAAILRDDPPLASKTRGDLPAGLDRLIARCLEKDPLHRFQSCRELLGEWQCLSDESGNENSRNTHSLAVLPFADLSPDRDQDYFCDGMAEEILSSLSRVDGLNVASRTSSFQFKGLAIDAREIGSRLQVKAILEGSVRKSGSRLRITAQLTDSDSGYQLWSERFDRDLEDVFEIQDEIAHRIAEALEIQLGGGELHHAPEGSAPNARAYDLYLRGRSFFYQGTLEAFELAEEYFRQAIELDSHYASPWAGIADCKSQIFREFDRRPEHLEGARAAAARALEIDPGSAHAHTSLGFTLSLAGQRAAGEESFQRALDLDPGLFDACYLYASEMLYGWGDLERAAELFRHASEIDGNDYQSLVILASVQHGLSQTEAARKAARRGLELAQRQLGVSPGDLRATYLSAEALVLLGEEKRALQMAERALDLDGGKTSLVLYNVASVMAMLGCLDEAIDLLEKAVDRGHGRADAFRFDPLLVNLRDDPRLHDLLARMNGRDDAGPGAGPS
jgi:serine/threonine protein kinase/tetratricopeptide (TPR) repeat protein